MIDSLLLARIIHEISTAAGDTPYPAEFARVEVLQPTPAPSVPRASGATALTGRARGPYVLSSTPPGPSGRNPTEHSPSPFWQSHLMNDTG